MKRRGPWSRAGLLGVGLAFALLTGGCASAPAPEPLVRSYVAQPAGGRLARVLLLPARNETATGAASRVVDRALALELLRRQRFELVQLPPDVDADRFLATLRVRGRERTDALVRLGRSLGVDAVIAPVVMAYDPYDPPLLAVRAVLIGTRDGRVLWGAEGVFDAREDRVRRAALSFSASGAKRSQHGPEIVLASGQQYARFACAQLAATLP
ncbi:MAG: hypothetical protein D6776_04890 [Planctomycetota bacterium]|nr:MAG: hypothetical protein D6776_04890 [Planctomycetota bacterium]